jgi:hypothetical protein
MLIIRNAQMHALALATLQRLEPEAVLQLRARRPDQVGQWEAEVLLAHIRDGIARAWGYGLGTRRSVLQYLDLMTAHGAGFETREPFVWARAILEDASIADPNERMGRLAAEMSMREARAARSEQARKEFSNAKR